jgi:hypothetical protein
MKNGTKVERQMPAAFKNLLLAIEEFAARPEWRQPGLFPQGLAGDLPLGLCCKLLSLLQDLSLQIDSS